ncbi:MAG: hypothetical protein ACSHX7_13390 [Luteolibacter sp.]
MFLVLRSLVFFILLFLSTGIADARVWKTTHGREFQAEFLRMQGTDVVFQTSGGRVFTTPILDLSRSDQTVIRSGVSAPIEGLRSNFGRPWPRYAGASGRVVCKIVTEDSKKSRYVYQSDHYKFYCDARITHDALSNFGVLFEATRAYLAALPISLMSGETISDKSRVLLFGEKSGYHEAGGLQGSAGCFMPRHRLVLIPMESLGLKKGGTGFSRDTAKKNQVLIHELVHQLTPNAYFSHGSLGWFSEGLAEYVAATPYSTGNFRPDIHGNAVKDYVTAKGTNGDGGRNLGGEISAPPLKYLFLMDYRSFSGSNGNLNYGLGLLLTHYFFHMEGDGKARRMTKFLKGLHDGKRGELALAPLLAGGSYEKLEGEITAAWAKKGVNISFLK